jgi:hypothetical protein
MGIFDIFPNPEPLPDNDNYISRVAFGTGCDCHNKRFVISQIRNPEIRARVGEYVCSCHDWIRSRKCKHVDFLVSSAT